MPEWKKNLFGGENFLLRRAKERPCLRKGVGGAKYFEERRHTSNQCYKSDVVKQQDFQLDVLKYGSDNMHLFYISGVKWLSKQASFIHNVLKLQ